MRICLFQFFVLLTCATVLCACATSSPSLPMWTGQEITAQFTARVRPQAKNIPLQGGIHLTAAGGRLGLITQHGRTLGQCVFTPSHTPKEAVVWRCTPTPNLPGAKKLLTRVANAVYQTMISQKDIPYALQYVLHKDNLGEVDIYFLEIKRP